MVCRANYCRVTAGSISAQSVSRQAIAYNRREAWTITAATSSRGSSARPCKLRTSPTLSNSPCRHQGATRSIRSQTASAQHNGSSYIASELAEWLHDKGMKHSRGAPYHPQTQGKIERWHQTLKNRILLENYFLPGDLKGQIEPSSATTIISDTTRACKT